MRPVTRIRSTVMGVLASRRFLEIRRARARLRRKLRGQPAVVHYFHQADDPYSHLAIQKLEALKRSYHLPFVPHLVSPPSAAFQGDESRFKTWALRDADSIAAAYGVQLENDGAMPVSAKVTEANRVLAAHLDSDQFAAIACEVGANLWRHRGMEDSLPRAECTRAMDEGDALRTRLGHYLGAMFNFDGEWFWGLDRMHLLEQRLRDEGYADPHSPVCVPVPEADAFSPGSASNITLEYFPSLRSPYTAIGHQRVMDLVAASGVNLELRPVIPMMMRGVPAPRAKQLYIMSDAAREARFHEVPFGKFVDSLGEPVKRAFALFPAACRQGKGNEFVAAYLAAAFAEGIDITTVRGLTMVMQRAGMDAGTAFAESVNDDWESELDANLDVMKKAGLWGVPSFRVTDDSSGAPPFACWGQDRIWRVQSEIAKRVKLIKEHH